MRFDLEEKKGHKVSFVVNDEPRIRTKEPIGYKYMLDELYIDDKLIDKSRNGKYFLAEFGYYNNGKEPVFGLNFQYDICKEICKIFNVKMGSITFTLNKEIEEYFINVLNPKGEKLLNAALNEIENEIIKKDKLIDNDTVININYNTSYGYKLYCEVSPASKLLSEIENKLNNNKKIFKKTYFKKFETDCDWGDYSITTSYTMSYSQLKEIIKEIDNDIEEYEITKALKEKEKQEHIDSLKKLAKETGMKQEYNKWSEPCDDPREDCSVDLVVEYIMPYGTFEIEKFHTW